VFNLSRLAVYSEACFMNTDRELLELAAKAAGLKYAWIKGCGINITGPIPAGQSPWWNPLADDGDALRLAVAMRAYIEIRVNAGYCVVRAHYCDTDEREMVRETPGDSVCALRRAITRAAAEIGKAMP
jgi:hypothetical protein